MEEKQTLHEPAAAAPPSATTPQTTNAGQERAAAPAAPSSDGAIEQAPIQTSDNNGGKPSSRNNRLYRTTQLIGVAALAVALVLLLLLPNSSSPGFDKVMIVIFALAGAGELYNTVFTKRTLLRLTSESHIALYETRVKGVGFTNEKKEKMRRVEFDYEYSDLVGVSASNDILTIYPFARSAIMCYALNAEELKDLIHDKSWEQR
mgnify:CR=1 FL=1